MIASKYFKNSFTALFAAKSKSSKEHWSEIFWSIQKYLRRKMQDETSFENLDKAALLTINFGP